MTAPQPLLAGPWGPVLAILAMSVATFLCRIAGAVLMSRIRPTRRVERGLRALPGSIIMATIAPIAFDAGIPALLSLGATVAATAWTRKELIGLATGLGTLALIRAVGL